MNPKVEQILKWSLSLFFIITILWNTPNAMRRTARGEPIYTFLSGDVYVIPYLTQHTFLYGAETKTEAMHNVDFIFNRLGIYSVAFSKRNENFDKLNFTISVEKTETVTTISDLNIGFIGITVSNGDTSNSAVVDITNSPGR